MTATATKALIVDLTITPPTVYKSLRQLKSSKDTKLQKAKVKKDIIIVDNRENKRG